MRPGTKSHALMLGPRGLLAGVLLRAIDDVREGNGYAASAAMWINDNRGGGIISFLQVCEWLDLDPGAVRGTLRKGKK